MGALVLSRKVDEKVIIGDDIEVTVVEIRGDKVRLAFTAPKEVSIHRLEIYLAIQREKIHAADAACDVKGLAGANAEMEMYRSGDHKQIYSGDAPQGE